MAFEGLSDQTYISWKFDQELDLATVFNRGEKPRLTAAFRGFSPQFNRSPSAVNRKKTALIKALEADQNFGLSREDAVR